MIEVCIRVCWLTPYIHRLRAGGVVWCVCEIHFLEKWKCTSLGFCQPPSMLTSKYNCAQPPVALRDFKALQLREITPVAVKAAHRVDAAVASRCGKLTKLCQCGLRNKYSPVFGCIGTDVCK